MWREYFFGEVIKYGITGMIDIFVQGFMLLIYLSWSHKAPNPIWPPNRSQHLVNDCENHWWRNPHFITPTQVLGIELLFLYCLQEGTWYFDGKYCGWVKWEGVLYCLGDDTQRVIFLHTCLNVWPAFLYRFCLCLSVLTINNKQSTAEWCPFVFLWVNNHFTSDDLVCDTRTV